MGIVHKKKSFFNKDLLFKLLIFIGTLSVIVYFLPREGKFNYQFSINKPWKYGQLIATFDFPIYKSSTTVKLEHDSLLARFQPYYVLDSSIEKETLKQFRNKWHLSAERALPPHYVLHIEQLLHHIYQMGILSTDDYMRLTSDSTKTILAIVNKTATSQPLHTLYTVKSAYEYLLQADTAHYKQEYLRQFNLHEYLTPNLHFDNLRTATAKQELLNSYSWAKGKVITGQKIIDRGEIVSPETFLILESLRQESIERSESQTQKRLILIGQILFVAILLICFMVYLEMFRKGYYHHKASLSLLFILVTLYSVSTALMVKHDFLNVNIMPYVMLPIIIGIFLDSRTAFLAHTITILICSITLRFPYEFLLTQLAAGMIAIYSLRELSQRSQLVRTAILVTLTYITVFFSYELIVENDFHKFNTYTYIYFCINGFLLLFAYPLLFVLEKLFRFTSNVTLVELSNINSEPLRLLSERAPGTFQHSMQVANLASAAATAINANSQLVRTGALYHDIGKMANPGFFTENQSGSFNPHKSLSYEQSAQIIFSHVTEGLKMADKYGLPKVVKDFIETHHGKGKAKYFYISWKNEHPGEEPEESLFTYPGKNPETKETAILMMADSVEAASRSLPDYTEESISNLVNKIIDTQLSEGNFKNCNITFKDIEKVKTIFKEKLKIIYHTRISYPELKKE